MFNTWAVSTCKDSVKYWLYLLNKIKLPADGKKYTHNLSNVTLYNPERGRNANTELYSNISTSDTGETRLVHLHLTDNISRPSANHHGQHWSDDIGHSDHLVTSTWTTVHHGKHKALTVCQLLHTAQWFNLSKQPSTNASVKTSTQDGFFFVLRLIDWIQSLLPVLDDMS